MHRTPYEGMKQPTLRETVYTDEFCRANGRIIYAMALKILGDRERARDLVQKVWLRVLKYGGEFRQEAERATYIYRIAANECLRDLKNDKRSFEEFNVEQLLSDDVDPHTLLELGEMIQEVDRCIERLTPLQKASMTLHFYAGLSYREVADVLGVSEDVVSGAILRGRYQVKKTLEKKGVAR